MGSGLGRARWRSGLVTECEQNVATDRGELRNGQSEVNDRSAESVAIARELLAECRWGALATLRSDGAPFSSLVAVAADDGAPILLLSGLAAHTRNLVGDPRASLLLTDVAGGAGPFTAKRLTLVGAAAVASDPEAAAAFLAGHPSAGKFARFADFVFYRFRAEAAHLVAGFGKIVDLPPEALVDRGGNG